MLVLFLLYLPQHFWIWGRGLDISSNLYLKAKQTTTRGYKFLCSRFFSPRSKEGKCQSEELLIFFVLEKNKPCVSGCRGRENEFPTRLDRECLGGVWGGGKRGRGRQLCRNNTSWTLCVGISFSTGRCLPLHLFQ